MDAQYKRHAHIGPGGMKCPCCAPAPGKDRAAAKRHWKRSERQAWKAEAAIDADRAGLPDEIVFNEQIDDPCDELEAHMDDEDELTEWFEDWSEGCAA